GSDTLWGSMDELGIWNRALTTAEISSIATYASFGLSLEDLVTGVVLPQSQFTGNSAANNLASTAGNWTVDPALWAATTEVIVANGTTASFSGANTGPAVFDSTFGSKVVRNVLVGASGTSTFVEMTGNAELIGDGNPQTRIGVDGSTVRWTMSGNSRIEHRGAGEETSRFMIGLPGSATTVVMNDSSELTTGPRVADPTFAVGYRRTQPTNNPGEPPRRGDDLFFGEGNNGPASTVDVTLNNDAFIWVVDVLYPGDSNNTLVNVTQNNNSEVIVGWDTRFLDDGHPATTGVNWTMNDNSRFLVGRDHGLGETGGSGFVNVTVNDNAYFYAGDRIVIGAGGGNINVTINDNGHMKVGGDSPTDVLLVDDTGESAPGGSPRAVDWILHMGGSANAQLNVNGGHVEIGRNAYVGRGGGSAVVNMSGGLFEVKGVGPIAVGLGNSPGGGVPSTVNWANNGGALLVGFDSGDNGVFNYQGGKVDVATDVLVGLDGDLSGSGGSGKLIVSGTAGPAEGLEVGRNLSFGGVILGGSLLAGSEGKGSFEAVAGLGTFKPVTVTGDVGIFSGDGLTGLATLDFAFEPGARPTPGATSLVYDVIQYGGVRVGTFDELDAGGLALRADRNGLDYSVLYDDANKKISVRVDFVFAPGDANYDGKVDALDLDIWKTNVGLSSATFAQGDWNGDSVVDGADFLLWQRNLGTMLTPPALVAGGAVPEPSTAVLMLSIGVVAARRRRSAA
ncbi:MAG TPA: PEP-CTERM sorting domain-containing protein, partial [Lacipirellulaceae bacterium]|nr:PEP-CTERM sorting domain-containing protein [Lacipirellulaceae bacterium]